MFVSVKLLDCTVVLLSIRWVRQTIFKGSSSWLLLSLQTRDGAIYQEGREVVTINEWTDRIYQHTNQEHIITNVVSGRKMRLQKYNFPDTGERIHELWWTLNKFASIFSHLESVVRQSSRNAWLWWRRVPKHGLRWSWSCLITRTAPSRNCFWILPNSSSDCVSWWTTINLNLMKLTFECLQESEKMKFEEVPAKPKSATRSTPTAKPASASTRCTTDATLVLQSLHKISCWSCCWKFDVKFLCHKNIY